MNITKNKNVHIIFTNFPFGKANTLNFVIGFVFGVGDVVLNI